MLFPVYIVFCGIIYETLCCPSETNCPNITVAVFMEKFQVADAPFQINRSINKSRQILKDSANLNFIIRYADVVTCTALEWGALAAEVYHNNEIHSIIGPGKYQQALHVQCCKRPY